MLNWQFTFNCVTSEKDSARSTSHLPRILRADSDPKLSTDKRVVDKVCDVLECLPIVLADADKQRYRHEDVKTFNNKRKHAKPNAVRE